MYTIHNNLNCMIAAVPDPVVCQRTASWNSSRTDALNYLRNAHTKHMQNSQNIAEKSGLMSSL